MICYQIRFNAHKFTGEVAIHCHFLNHEDDGMMMTVEIVEPGKVQLKSLKREVHMQ